MILPGTDVIKILAQTSVSRRPDHVRPTRATQQAREQVRPPLRFLEVHPPLERFANLNLHPVKLLLRDDRFMASVLHRIAPANLPEID